jgi:hypothetical protein
MILRESSEQLLTQPLDKTFIYCKKNAIIIL